MTSNAAYNTSTNTAANTRNPLTSDGGHNDRNPMTGDATHNTHNPLTGDGVTNTHNPLTGDKTGPNPPGTNPVTGRTRDEELGRNEQQPVGQGAVGAGVTSGTNTHNTHNPLTGDKTGPHPPSGTNPVTGHTREGDLGRNEQQPGGYAGNTGGYNDNTSGYTGNTGGFADNTRTGHATGAGTTGTNTHNTHNPLTGDGVTNTHNPLTGDKTGPHPPSGTNPVTGRTRDNDLGRNERQSGGAGYDTTSYGTQTSVGTQAGSHTIHDTTHGTHTGTGIGTTGATGATGTTGTGAHPTSTRASGGSGKALVGKVEATLGAIINNSEMIGKGVQKQEEARAAKAARRQEGAHDAHDHTAATRH